jgi:hypothetical protein
MNSNEQFHHDIAELRSDFSDLRTDLKVTNTTLSKMAETLAKITDDHEHRIREIEKDRWMVRGVLTLLGFIGFPTLCLLVYMVATKTH